MSLAANPFFPVQEGRVARGGDRPYAIPLIKPCATLPIKGNEPVAGRGEASPGTRLL